MFVRCTSLSIALLALFLAACSSTTTVHAPPVAMSTTPITIAGGRFPILMHTNVAYGPLPLEVMDICTPVAVGTHPGVILIHGGGWAAGDKSYYDSGCQNLAAAGVVAATIDYRLAPTARWPAQLVDAQLAVRWLRANAANYSLDTNRLCSWGDSAGGHLAVFLGVDKQIHSGDEANLLTDQAPNVSTCVVDAYGPVDLTGLVATTLQRQILQNFIGATPQQNPDAYRDASPLLLVSAHALPTLIIQGSRDTLVPTSQSRALQAALQAHHIPVQYISYDGDHAFGGLTATQQNAIIQQAALYLAVELKP